jgi:hypothetical protein
MFWVDFLVVFFIALLLAAIFGIGIRKQPIGADLGIFFLLLLLLTWAGGLWLAPIGPPVWGSPWLSFLLVGFLLVLLFAALTPPYRQPRNPRKVEQERQQAYQAAIAVNAFLWVLIISLILVIFIAYLF